MNNPKQKSKFIALFILLFTSFVATNSGAKSYGERLEAIYQNSPIIAEEVSQPDGNGVYKRIRIVQGERDLIRLAASVQKDPATGQEKFLSYEADAADEVIVSLKHGQDQAALEAVLQNLPGQYRVIKEPLSFFYIVKVLNPTLHTLPEVIRQLSERPEIEYAESNAIFLLNGEVIPNDPLFAMQWHLEKINMPQAWNITTGDKKVVVAVIDSGVDYNHPDLKNNMWKNKNEIPNNGIDDDHNFLVDDYHGFDFHDWDPNPMTSYFHGTAVSGIIGAMTNNGSQIAGIAWNVQIMPIRVASGGEGSGKVGDLTNGIIYALANGADIINASVGGPHRKSLLQVVEAAGPEGVLIVAAAGNDGEENTGKTTNHEFPASYNGFSHVISVGSSVQDDSLATLSNTNNLFASNYSASRVDLVAPGLEIITIAPGFQYFGFAATSSSAPQVSAVAALLKSVRPDLDAVDLKSFIVHTVDKIPALEGKVKTSGRLNAYRALLHASPGVIKLNTPQVEVTEQEGKIVKIEVERINGVYGDATLSVKGNLLGNATLGADYMLGDVSAWWKNGVEGKKYLTFILKNDKIIEEDNEYIFANLEASGAAYNGASATVVIKDDNEPTGKIVFGDSFMYVSESAGTVNVELKREGGSNGPKRIYYQIRPDGPGAAWNDFDVVQSTGVITWNPGNQDTKKISIHIVNDSEKEGQEKIRIDMKELKEDEPVPPGNVIQFYPSPAFIYIEKSDQFVIF